MTRDDPTGDAGSADPARLLGEWRVLRVPRRDEPDEDVNDDVGDVDLGDVDLGDVVATVGFAADDDTGVITRIAGRSGVNRYTGRVDVDGPVMRLGALATTRLAGPPHAMAVETEVLRALGAIVAWRPAGPDTVALVDHRGAVRIVLGRDPD